MALEHGIDEARDPVAVLAGGKRWRTAVAGCASLGDERVDVTNHIRERIAPSFLMSARKMRVRPCRRGDERRILGEDLVGRIAMTDPELVLLFLAPAQRCFGCADLQPQIVLVASTHL